MGRLENKVAIVTGAIRVGAVTAELFAKEGAKVVIADFTVEKGREQTDKTKAAGGECSFVNTDVSKSEGVQDLVKFTVDTHGRLDSAINNAAITPDDKPIANFDEAYWDGLLSIDLKGVAALCLKYEVRQMMAPGGGGSIVNASSVNGIRSTAWNPAYIAAKHAVISLTKSAAMDYSPNGIRINSVAPGGNCNFFDTILISEAMKTKTNS